MSSSNPPKPSIPDDTGPTPLCVQHGQEIREVRQDVKELRAQNATESGLLRDVRERVIVIETRLEAIGTHLTKHTDRAQDLFFRYAWPLILVGLTAAVTKLLGGGM